MGANQSNSGDVIPSSGDNSIYHQGNFKGYHHSSSNHRPTDRRNKEKPSPPKKPVATDVGSNSITLSWSAPRSTACNSIIAYALEMVILSPASDRQWRTVTKCCQGTSYDVRHLDPDTGHVFRVRAENVYGVSKPSPPSDVITTRMYEEPRDAGFHCDPVPACSLVDTTGQNFKRRHSFSVHLDGGITKILNHTDIVLTPATLSGSGSQPGERSLSRNSIHRTSLQNNRKISQPILFAPVNGDEFFEWTQGKDLKKVDLGSLSSLHSDTTVSNCRDLHSDCGSKNISVDSFSDSSDRTKLACSDSVDTIDKLCPKSVKVEKMALIQKNFRNESNFPSTTGSDSAAPPCVRCDDRRDFRSLRSVLQSNNMIVKSSISLPDVAGMVIGDSGDVVPFTKGRLTTIVDADEEEDTVRITTL
ncbi:hypothetical protein Btru_006484 [Bulinus truncatus]|nr:hypothetical protein Btru_006484 [Bulinus truncatus]